MKTLFFRLACLFLGACTALSVQAQNQLSLGELGEGQLVLNMSLNEQEQVEQDTLNANLQFVVQGRDRRELQNEVNDAMRKALALVRAEPALEVRTTFYQVQIVQTGRPNRTDITDPVFRAQQGMYLNSTDSALLLEMIASLQEAGLTLNGLYYSLSEEVHERISSELLERALGRLQARAEGAAEALGKSSAALVEVSMDSTPLGMAYRQRPMMEAMSAADADFNVPVADPGETRISVSVSARAILSP